MKEKIIQLTLDEAQTSSILNALDAAMDCCTEDARIFRGMGSMKNAEDCDREKDMYRLLKFKIEKAKEAASV